MLNFAISSTICVTAAMAETSALWGADGELSTPAGRLPDFSFAGYRRGEAPLPTPPVTASVKDFGAVGDGTHDDSDAFIRAAAEAPAGAILIPEGRYVITKIVRIDRPNIVFRGEDRDKSVLYFPTPLNDIEPNWGATTSGQRTSNYSWSGGFFWMQGSYQANSLTAITEDGARGDYSVVVEDASKLAVGQEIDIRQQDLEDNSLANHLYSGDPRISMEKILGRTRVSLVTRITAIDGARITFDRPLRFDILPKWTPEVAAFAPTVTECGVENLTFEYPVTPYCGHFTELGNNAVAMTQVAHCWTRNLRIRHADSGVFMGSQFCTVDGILFESDRERDANRNATGHHGVTLGGNDNFCTNFDFRTKFVHDLTVSGSAGNVSSNGRGDDLSFDHHRRAPYDNLFTNIDVGAGGEVWRSGGGADLGAHCGGRGTFWNIRATNPMQPPPPDFGPWSMNIVGLFTEAPSETNVDGKWFEAIAPEKLMPSNLHEAQREKRLRKTKP